VSTAIPTGLQRLPDVAGPVSPANVHDPFPATVRMISFAASVPAATIASVPGTTRLIRCVDWSAISSAPVESNATPTGLHRLADVAGPPSPCAEHDPFPATVTMIPVARYDPADPVVRHVADEEVPRRVQAHRLRILQRRRRRRPAVASERRRPVTGHRREDPRHAVDLPHTVVRRVGDVQVPVARIPRHAQGVVQLHGGERVQADQIRSCSMSGFQTG